MIDSSAPTAPHGGTWVSTANGFVEISVFETGVPPHFRLYFYTSERVPCPPPAPDEVSLETVRPDGAKQVFSFVHEPGCLRSTDDIPEPHEFLVSLRVKEASETGFYETAFTEEGHSHGPGGHNHGDGLWGLVRGNVPHSHRTEDKVDANIESNARGIWAIKVSLLGMLVTAVLQLVVVFYSGSVALLADTIHNFGDAGTSIPLWIAFALTLRGALRKYSYGYGKTEDLAGVVIILIIFFSACVAGYESMARLLNPQPMTNLWVVALAAVIGFAGNEAVAVFRLRVGREIDSAALIADGYHARTDGFTSLAVLGGVIGTWLGFPILDPLIGLGITIAILFIVKDSVRSIFHRMLDGIEPEILETIEMVPLHVSGVRGVSLARARWVGHKVLADLQLELAPSTTVEEAQSITTEVEAVLGRHLKAFGGVVIQTGSKG